jgi:hypothetical protein
LITPASRNDEGEKITPASQTYHSLASVLGEFALFPEAAADAKVDGVMAARCLGGRRQVGGRCEAEMDGVKNWRDEVSMIVARSGDEELGRDR